MLKKIKSREEVAKKNQRNQLIVGGVLIFLLVISTAGYAFINQDGGSQDFVEEKGQKFYRNGEIWALNFEGQQFGFSNLPSEVQNVSITGEILFENYYGKVIYVVNDNPASQEILANFGRYFARYQGACMSNCSGDLPLKTCQDNLIVFNESAINMVERVGNCTYISGEFIKSSDAFLYRLLGIQ